MAVTPEFTFVERAELEGTLVYFLLRTDMKLSGKSSVVRDLSGRVPRFATDDEARVYARSMGLTPEPGFPTHIYDLDVIQAWCLKPEPQTLNAAQLFMIWMLLQEAGLTTIPDDQFGDDDLVAKLCEYIDPAWYTRAGWQLQPWTDSQVRLIADSLRPIVEQLVHEFEPVAV